MSPAHGWIIIIFSALHEHDSMFLCLSLWLVIFFVCVRVCLETISIYGEAEHIETRDLRQQWVGGSS